MCLVFAGQILLTAQRLKWAQLALSCGIVVCGVVLRRWGDTHLLERSGRGVISRAIVEGEEEKKRSTRSANARSGAVCKTLWHAKYILPRHPA